MRTSSRKRLETSSQNRFYQVGDETSESEREDLDEPTNEHPRRRRWPRSMQRAATP